MSLSEGKLIGYDQVRAQMTINIPNEHYEMLYRAETLFKEHYMWFVNHIVPIDKLQYAIYPIVISDGRAKMPPGVKEIIGCYGKRGKSEEQEKEEYIKEMVGYIDKCSEDTSYTVIRTSPYCDKTNCESPIVLAVEDLHEQVMDGDRAMIYRHYWGTRKKDGGYYDPYAGRFHIMAPRLSSFMDVDKTNAIKCLEFDCPEDVSKDWEYEIQDGEILTHFKEGLIFLSARSKIYDQKGLLMFPYDEYVIKALRCYIAWNLYIVLDRAKGGRFGRLAQEAEGYYMKAEREAKASMGRIGFHKFARIMTSFRNNVIYSQDFKSITSFNSHNNGNYYFLQRKLNTHGI